MLTLWFKTEDPKHKEKIHAEVKSFLLSDAGKRFMELLELQEKSVTDMEVSLKTYDCPSWSNKQAHLNGFRQATKQVKKLFELDNKEKV